MARKPKQTPKNRKARREEVNRPQALAAQVKNLEVAKQESLAIVKTRLGDLAQTIQTVVSIDDAIIKAKDEQIAKLSPKKKDSETD